MKCVLFDLDETLFDHRYSCRKIGIKSIWFNRRNETNFAGDIAEVIYKPNDLIEKLNLV